MAVSPTKLTIMSFPQRWDDGTMHLRLLVLPHEDPLASFTVGIPTGVTAPAFANARLRFQAMLINSLDSMPRPADVTHTVPLSTTPPPNAQALFRELAKAYKITKPSNVLDTPRRARSYRSTCRRATAAASPSPTRARGTP